MDDAALDPLPEEVVLSLAGEHLGGLEGVYVAPDVPQRKIRAARSTHALHLSPEEPVLALFDATVFGSAAEGFIATPARFCWKNLLEHARALRWAEVARTPVVAGKFTVEIAGGKAQAPWVPGGGDRLRAFLIECGRRTQGQAAPYRQVVRDRTPRTLAQWIVQHARRELGELDWVHYRPSIPAKMAAAARRAHRAHLAQDEEILVLYDETVFGSGSDGFILTERGVCWRNLWEPAGKMEWGALEPEHVAVDGNRVTFDGDILGAGDAAARRGQRWMHLGMQPGMAAVVAPVLQEIARLVRAHGPAPREKP